MLKGTCWLVHGIRSDGTLNVDRLRPYAEAAGYVVREFEYGWTHALMAWWMNDRRAHLLSKLVQPGDVAIGHSNGCAILDRATDHGAAFDTLVYVTPALEVEQRPASQVRRLFVFYSPDDKATWVARLFRWLPGSRWGAMGRYGYEGITDMRIRSIDLHNALQAKRLGHSGMFSGDWIERFGELVQLALSVPEDE